MSLPGNLPSRITIDSETIEAAQGYLMQLLQMLSHNLGQMAALFMYLALGFLAHIKLLLDSVVSLGLFFSALYMLLAASDETYYPLYYIKDLFGRRTNSNEAGLFSPRARRRGVEVGPDVSPAESGGEKDADLFEKKVYEVRGGLRVSSISFSLSSVCICACDAVFRVRKCVSVRGDSIV